MASGTPASTGSVGRLGSGVPEPDDTGARRRPGLTPLSLFLVLILVWIVTQIQIVLMLGLLALLLGTILEGPVSLLERRHVPRPAAIALVYAVFIGGLALFIVAIVPIVADQADTFQQEVPEKLRQLEVDWRNSSNPLLSAFGDRALQSAIDFIDSPSGNVSVSSDAAQQLIPVVASIGTVIVSLISLLVITFYYLLEKSLLKRVILGQVNERSRARVDKVWRDVESKVGGWIRGQLVLCLIIGSIATISYGIIGLPFWPLLGLWAGLTEFLPIVGPWIGGVPAVILAMTVGWDKALLTAIVILAMQSLENWFLVPRVMRGAVGLTPLTVFLAILAGQQFLGIVGAILAIPIAATIQVIVTDFLNARRIEPQEDLAVSGWRWMLARASARDGSGDDERSEVAATTSDQIVSEITVPARADHVDVGEVEPVSVPPAPTPDTASSQGWSWHQKTGSVVKPTRTEKPGSGKRKDS